MLKGLLGGLLGGVGSTVDGLLGSLTGGNVNLAGGRSRYALVLFTIAYVTKYLDLLFIPICARYGQNTFSYFCNCIPPNCIISCIIIVGF